MPLKGCFILIFIQTRIQNLRIVRVQFALSCIVVENLPKRAREIGALQGHIFARIGFCVVVFFLCCACTGCAFYIMHFTHICTHHLPTRDIKTNLTGHLNEFVFDSLQLCGALVVRRRARISFSYMNLRVQVEKRSAQLRVHASSVV